MSALIRWILLIVLLALTVAVLFYGTIDIVLPHLQENILVLREFVDLHKLSAIMIFITLTAILINFPIPLAALLKLLAGFLFGAALGSIVNVIATFIGSIVGFLAARHWFRERFEERFHKRMAYANRELSRFGFYYFILLRILLIVPYYLIHAIAGLSHIRLKTYAWSSLLGVIPGSILYAYAGSQMQQFILPGFQMGWKQMAFMASLVLVFVTIRIYRKRVHINL